MTVEEIWANTKGHKMKSSARKHNGTKYGMVQKVCLVPTHSLIGFQSAREAPWYYIVLEHTAKQLV